MTEFERFLEDFKRRHPEWFVDNVEQPYKKTISKQQPLAYDGKAAASESDWDGVEE